MPGDQQGGIRLTRAGGDKCEADKSQLYSLTVDVWCNPFIVGTPKNAHVLDKGPLEDDEIDNCNIYVTMEHANGCVVFDFGPFLLVLGFFMIFSGICLQWMGPNHQQKFMIFLVRLGTFLVFCSFAYEQNYFAFFDPSEPPAKQDPVKAFGALTLAFLAQWIVGLIFRYSIRLAPTLLGVYTGYFISIYVIFAINGF